MTNLVKINRPWQRSFSWGLAPYSDTKLEQVHKLCRNLVASLNLQCPGVVHVMPGRGLPHLATGADKYRAWVADWKLTYAELSELIRLHKQWRKTARFPALTPDQLAKVPAKENPQQYLRELSAHHLPRLQETAMVMLNARYNAKLAGAEARRRELAAQPKPEEKMAA